MWDRVSGVWPRATVSSFLLSASYRPGRFEMGSAALFAASLRGPLAHGATLARGHVLILSGSLPAAVGPQSRHCAPLTLRLL